MVSRITSTNCVWLDVFYNYIFIYFFSFVVQHPQSQGGFESSESDADLGSTLNCVYDLQMTDSSKQTAASLVVMEESLPPSAGSELSRKKKKKF